jgi:hypothetical protein
MNTIQSVFTERGFTHREVARRGEWRVFERRGAGKAHWEVVRIRWRDEFTVAGRVVPAGEVYPRSAVWGTDGFTFVSLELAKARFAEMAIAPSTSSQGDVGACREG